MSGAAIAAAFGIKLPPGLLEAVARGELPGAAYERELADDRAGRRAAGAYYTPPHLVDLVVHRALGPALDGARLDELLALRVIDPACGAGVFLVAALRAIVNRLRALAPPSRLPALIDAVASDCLHGIDVDATAVELTKLAVAAAAREAGGGDPARLDVHTRLRCADAVFGDDLERAFGEAARFHAVLGNPPWGQKSTALTDDQRAFVRARYATGKGVVDPYALFVERGVGLLRRGGRLGFVVPDIVLLKNQQDVRDLLLELCAIEWLVDCGRAFPDVNLDAVAVIARRSDEGPSTQHRVRVWHSLPERWREAPPREHTVAQATFWQLDGHKLNIRLTERSFALWRKLAGCARLSSVFEAHEGVHTGNARHKLFVPQPGPRTARVVIGRGELRRYVLEWGGTWLDLRPEALDRDAGDYANLGRPEWHERPKIVVRRTGDQVIAALDADGVYVSNNMFVLLPLQPLTTAELRAYVGLLNSALTTWYYRTVQPRTGRLFAELKIYHVLDFPLPAAGAWRGGWERLAELSAEIEGRARGGHDAARLQAELDARVMAMFDLAPDERELVLAG